MTDKKDKAEEKEVLGVKGQIEFPPKEIDAERAAAFAAGKEDTLYPDEDPTVDRGLADHLEVRDKRTTAQKEADAEEAAKKDKKVSKDG